MDGTEDGRGVGPLLRARGIEKFFGPVHALKHVDFEVRPNEIVALIGDNGAGKSTLINVLTGVLPYDAGEDVFDGGQGGLVARLSRNPDGTWKYEALLELPSEAFGHAFAPDGT